MQINDVVLNVGQFFDEEINVIVGGVEVGGLSDENFGEPGKLIMPVDFSFHLYNMAYIDDLNELIAITEELSEEEAYIIHTLKQTQKVFTNENLVMTISDFNWLDEYKTLENKLEIIRKFISYCEYNNHDYIALIVEKEFADEANVTEFPKMKQYEALGFERVNIHPTPIMVKKLNEY